MAESLDSAVKICLIRFYIERKRPAERRKNVSAPSVLSYILRKFWTLLPLFAVLMRSNRFVF